MRFASPHWLWALAAIPVLLFLLRYDIERSKGKMRRFASDSFWKWVAPHLDWNARFQKGLVWIAALALIAVSLARPQWGKVEETVKVSGLDIVFALDVSNSMMVEDIVPSRLKKAKKIITEVTEGIEGDRAGVVAFAESNYLAVPITTDLGYLRDILDILDPKSVLTQGTNIGSALDTALKALDRAAEDPTRAASAGVLSKVIILVSDGEDHENEIEAIAARLKEVGVKLYIVGVGSEKGGPIPVRDEGGVLRGYKRDRSGTVVMSQFHPKELVNIAESAGGRYWNATSSGDEAKEIVQELGGLSRGDFAEKKIVTYQERFQIPLLLAFILLLIDLSISNRKKISTPIKAALYAFLFWTVFSSNTAMAYPGEGYFDNKKGIESLSKDQLDEAQKYFQGAGKSSPKRAEPKYNEAFVDLKKGDSDAALRKFDDAASMARESGDAKVESEALFNRGTVAAEKEQFDVATESYLEALDAARKSGNTELLKDAKKNLELLTQKKEQKQQQQKQQDQKQKEEQQKQDQENQKKGDGKNPGQQKDNQKDGSKEDPKKDQDKNGGKDEKKKDQNSEGRKKPQEFDSNKISKDSAKRVMSELSSREKDLQGKLKKQKGNPQPVEKDW